MCKAVGVFIYLCVFFSFLFIDEVILLLVVFLGFVFSVVDLNRGVEVSGVVYIIFSCCFLLASRVLEFPL